MARSLGDLPAVLRIVGCEPEAGDCADNPGLSPAVELALDGAVEMVGSIVTGLVAGPADAAHA
jgi:hypothetical protein